MCPGRDSTQNHGYVLRTLEHISCSRSATRRRKRHAPWLRVPTEAKQFASSPCTKKSKKTCSFYVPGAGLDPESRICSSHTRTYLVFSVGHSPSQATCSVASSPDRSKAVCFFPVYKKEQEDLLFLCARGGTRTRTSYNDGRF